jgi:hypothetical protein
MVGLLSRDQCAAGRVEICEAARRLRGAGVPGVTEAYINREVCFPLEAVLSKHVVRGLQDLVISRTQQIRKRIGFIREEVCKRRKVETSYVFRDVVVVRAPNFPA